MSDNKIIKSFFSKDELNPKIWNEDLSLNREVREKLLEISNEFIDFIGVPLVVDDIIFTGSLANFNWSEFSDIDLHVVCDFEQFSEETLPLYEELFKIKKTIFNNNHNIKIFGYEVELYVQNSSEAHFSSGVYSVMFDEWDVKPEKEIVHDTIYIDRPRVKIDDTPKNITSVTPKKTPIVSEKNDTTIIIAI